MTRPGAVSLLILAAACSAPKEKPSEPAAAPPATAQEATLEVPGGKIWYRTVGSGPGLPVILLHGGPGYSSFYLKSVEGLSADRLVVRYDQLGGGKSDRISDTTMFNIAHFVAELDSLRAHLGFDKVHLMGHSWGTILAVEYYRVHPEHVASMVLGSAALDIPQWERNGRRLIGTLPDSAQRAIRAAEKTHKFDDPAYQAALADFYGRYVWRHPVQADMDSLFATVNEGVYNYMQGPSEFTITGTLKNYNSTDFLPSVKVPLLYTVGEFDEADTTTIKHFASLSPQAQVAVIPGAAHITSWDNPEQNVRVMRVFLQKADGSATQ